MPTANARESESYYRKELPLAYRVAIRESRIVTTSLHQTRSRGAGHFR